MRKTDLSLHPWTPEPDGGASSLLDAGGAASAAGAFAWGGKPSLTIPEIADALLLDYWGFEEPHGFALGDDRTLTYDVSALGPKGARLARAAMREWGEATGIAFEPGRPTAPDVIRRPEVDPLASVDTEAELRLNEGVTGWIGEGDRDWVRVEVVDEAQAVLRVEGVGSRPLEDARLVIRDEEGRKLDFPVERRAGAALIEGDLSPGDIFYVEVGGKDGGTGLYRLTLLEARRARADIVFTDDEHPDGAFADNWRASNGDITVADINVPRSWLKKEGAEVGTYGFQTYLHEVGHALGLGHPGAYDGEAWWARDAAFAEDSWQTTVMSYFSQWENPQARATWAPVVTPMAADIEAVRTLYGAAEVRHGDTVYGDGANVRGTLARADGLENWVAFTIHDTGGHDLIDLGSWDYDQRLDLRPGGISDLFHLMGNAVLSLQTEIEDASLGWGNDQVFGNGAGNAIWGGGGYDWISGGAGADKLHGGADDDGLSGDAGRDALRGGAGEDVIWGGEGGDSLYGGLGGDRLWGNAGDDSLAGGAGGDRLRGGSGRDTLDGRSGADRLHGGAGDDILKGGGGGDRFVFEPGWGHDRVLDFGARVASEAVVLRGLEGVVAAEALEGGFRAFRSAHMSQDGEDVVIALDPESSLRLEGVAMRDLDAGDVWL